MRLFRSKGADLPPRILFVTTGMSGVGGIQRYCRQLAQALDVSFDLRVVDIGYSSRHRLTGIAGLVSSMIAARPDLVILGHVNLSPVGLLSRLFGLRFVVLVYGVDVWSGRSIRRDLGIRLATEVWSISDFTRSKALEAYPSLRSIRVIGAAVRSSWFAQQRSPSSPFRVLTVARLESLHGKGIDVCLAAISRIPESVSLEYVIVGTGAEESVLRLWADSTPRVKVRGALNDADLAREYSAASAVLLMSPFAEGKLPLGEGLGLVVLEGAAAGVPGIVAHAGGLTETVVHGITGFIVAPGDSTGVAERLAYLATNRAVAAELGDAARTRCRQLFSEGAYAERIAEAIASTRSHGR